MERQRRGAKVAYVKERRPSGKEVPAALSKYSLEQQPKEHWVRKRFKEREQFYDKQKNSPWRISDRRANKDGFRHDVYWVTGDLYRGHWKLNKKEGSGIQSYCTGNRYEGDWKSGQREGYGTFYIQEDGKYRVVYKGYWKAGNLHGPGYLHCAYGEVYEGDFENGMRSGYGRQTYWCYEKKGYHVYVGQWRLDKREGMGTLTLVNGDVYEGGFFNDMKHGKGVFSYTSTRSKYEGLWKEDVAICGTYLNVEDDDGDDENETKLSRVRFVGDDGGSVLLPLLELRDFDTWAEVQVTALDDTGISVSDRSTRTS